MSATALHVYATIREQGTQKNIINNMQLRDDLYKILHYQEHEDTIDKLLKNDKLPKKRK